jgi:hypothetical protein
LKQSCAKSQKKRSSETKRGLTLPWVKSRYCFADKGINADSRMRALCLLIALLSSATIGLVKAKAPNPGWEDFPRVLAAKRVMVMVVSSPDDSTLIVYVRDRGYLLLVASEPMLISMKGQSPKHFSYAECVGLEISLLLYEKTNQQVLSFELVPQVGYKWQIRLKSVQPLETTSA